MIGWKKWRRCFQNTKAFFAIIKTSTLVEFSDTLLVLKEFPSMFKELLCHLYQDV